jgi:hypothetical protein
MVIIPKERITMSRIMGDSTTLNDIPLSVEIAAVYINGHEGVVSETELEARFPHAHYGHVFIDVNGLRPDANVRDWETRDKAGSLRQWVFEHNMHTDRRDAVVYCNRSTIPEVRIRTEDQILGEDYYLWVATLDGSEFTGPGIIACQKDGERQTGGHWDRTKVYDDRFWLPVPSPTPVPHSKPDCRVFQRAVHAVPDNLWGQVTDKHAAAIIDATANHFPWGKNFAQYVVGTTVDGFWGPKSKIMLIETVISMQNALHHMGFDPQGVDGIWGPKTRSAFYAARKACHI